MGGGGRCGSRLPVPESAKELPVPAQDGLGLDDQDGLGSGPEAAGQQHQQRPIALGAARARDAAAQDEELLTQQRILGDEFGFTPYNVGQCADDERGGCGLGRCQEAALNGERDGTCNDGDTLPKMRDHG